MKKSISRLRKEANKAPKYVLQMDVLNFYVAETQQLSGVNLTNNINKARKYSVGFDNIEMKINVWNAAAKVMFNNSHVKFNVVYL